MSVSNAQTAQQGPGVPPSGAIKSTAKFSFARVTLAVIDTIEPKRAGIRETIVTNHVIDKKLRICRIFWDCCLARVQKLDSVAVELEGLLTWGYASFVKTSSIPTLIVWIPI